MKKLLFLFALSVGTHPLFSQSFSQEFSCQHRKSQKSLSTQQLYPSAANERSDSIDVLNYAIHLDITDFQNQKIAGFTDVTVTAEGNESFSQLPLDLLELQVDSVKQNQQVVPFTYNDTLLVAQLTATMSAGDTTTVRVYYQGSPQADNSWGGFYFTNNYAFNLGVGFDANPHNFGRVWYPCFDNFVERATYDFHIETSNGKVATCNGTLLSENSLPNGNTVRHFHLKDPIPTYLSAVAVAEYSTVNQIHSGITGNIPIELHAVPSDTQNLKNSFAHLTDAIACFENSYGVHRFEKVGYSLVPFNAGAMEHATNIAYPIYAADGSLANETLMAHELAHHWWGDYATCETQEDMWLNEGWASFSELLFTEHVYGKEAYQNALEELHADVLRTAHLNEGGFRAVSGIPHEITYGSHVYNKGALVAHNLRGYLGDQTFFSSISQFLESRGFNSMNSEQFRDSLSVFSGEDLTPFFTDWVFSGGWNDFELDSFQIIPVGNQFEITLFIEQKLFGKTQFHANVPLEVGFYQNDFSFSLDTILTNGAYTQATVMVDNEPTWITLNPTKQQVYANTDYFETLTAGNITVSGYSNMSVDVVNAGDSSLLRIEHHYTTPDPIKLWSEKPYRLGDHYWEVGGILHPDFEASATLFYDGRVNTLQLDSSLVAATEDSLFLLYRRNAKEDWVEYSHYTKNVLGSSTNQFGVIEISSLLAGQYALANIDHSVLSVGENTKRENSIQVYPNPTNGTIHFVGEKGLKGKIDVYTANGQLVRTVNLNGKIVSVNLNNQPSGTYHYKASDQNQLISSGSFIYRK